MGKLSLEAAPFFATCFSLWEGNTHHECANTDNQDISMEEIPSRWQLSQLYWFIVFFA